MGKASTYQRRARDFAQKADWDSALAELRQAIAADAGNPMLQNQMGDLFLRKEEVVQACQHFEKAIELYASLGLHNNAVALCRKVIRLCPSRLEVRYQLACLRHEQGLRSEASAFFADYFDHLPVDGEDSIRTLEERSTEVVENYPDAAPVGRILEKLEDARAFASAFALVQGLAQRAADAGDDDAARRYTTKMRSLRVLVESHGGDLPQAAKVPGDDVAEPGLKDAAEPPRSGKARPAGTTPQASQDEEPSPWLEPSAVFEPPALEVPEAAARQEELTTVDEDPAPEAEPVDLSQVLGEEGTDSSSRRDPAPVLEMPEPDAIQEDAGDALTAASAGASEPSEQEYEIPETSLEDVASLWAGDAETASANEDARETAEGADISEIVAMDAETPDVADPARNTEEASETVFHLGAHEEPESAQEVHPESPGGWAENGSRDAPSFDAGQALQEITPPETTPRWEAPATRSAAPKEKGLQDPVWVPEGEWGDSNQEPWPEAGSIHELSEVIETFRTQMAQALGNDAAARYDLGVAYYEMGLYNEALAEFEAAQPHAALRERSLEMMAACMAMQGRHAEILALLQPALESPTAPERVLGLRYSMGVACEALGRRDEARQHFEIVARIDSGYRDVSTRLQMR